MKSPRMLAMMHESLEMQVLSHLQSSLQGSLEVESLFSGGVEFLKSRLPNSAIKRMALVAYDILSYGIIPTCLRIPVPSMTFIVEGTLKAPQAVIAIPRAWSSMIRKDPLSQLGAVAFICSQAVDYYHDRLSLDPDSIRLRAHAYEAEYLNTIRVLAPQWELNRYQLQVLEEFPEGIATPKVHRALYDIRPFVTA